MNRKQTVEAALNDPDDSFFRKYLNDLYLAYFNDFLTVERFAECYELPEDLSNRVIQKGREINHSN